jgi:hypothetical protein
VYQLAQLREQLTLELAIDLERAEDGEGDTCWKSLRFVGFAKHHRLRRPTREHS